MDKKLYEVMNEQITKELFSAYLYLSMAGYFEAQGFSGMAHWMKKQAQEEVEHGMKIFEYLNDRGCPVVLGAFEKPKSDFASVRAVFEEALGHEKKVTASIHNLYSVATSLHDYAAVGFLQWFVDEQVEEEKNATDILTKLDLIGNNSMGLLMLDRELKSRE